MPVRIHIYQWKNINPEVSGFPFSLGKFHIRTCPDFHLSMKNFKSEHIMSGFEFRTRPDFNFLIEKFQIWTRPDFNFGYVWISIFKLRNFKSGRVRISIPNFRFLRALGDSSYSYGKLDEGQTVLTWKIPIV